MLAIAYVLDSLLQNWPQSRPGIGEAGDQGFAALPHDLCRAGADLKSRPSRPDLSDQQLLRQLSSRGAVSRQFLKIR